MAKSKYTRARIRAAGRQGKRRGGSRWFTGAMVVVAIVGIVGVALVIDGSESANVPPQPGNSATGEPGDHWHAALAANICGEWLPAPFEFENSGGNIMGGIHTHSDGVLHVEPRTSSEGGTNATFGRFLTAGGWSTSQDSLSLWTGPASKPARVDYTNGDKCPSGTVFAGQTGVVKYSIDCKEKSGNPANALPKDKSVITIGFVPKSESLGVPPNAYAAPADDGGNTTALNTAGCSAAAPGA